VSRRAGSVTSTRSTAAYVCMAFSLSPHLPFPSLAVASPTAAADAAMHVVYAMVTVKGWRHWRVLCIGCALFPRPFRTQVCGYTSYVPAATPTVTFPAEFSAADYDNVSTYCVVYVCYHSVCLRVTLVLA